MPNVVGDPGSLINTNSVESLIFPNTSTSSVTTPVDIRTFGRKIDIVNVVEFKNLSLSESSIEPFPSFDQDIGVSNTVQSQYQAQAQLPEYPGVTETLDYDLACSRPVQNLSRTVNNESLCNNPHHLVGIEEESIIKIIGADHLCKGDVLVKTRGSKNQYPLLSLTVEIGSDNETVVELVTAPLTLEEHCDYQTEDLLSIAKEILSSPEGGHDISLRQFAGKFNQHLLMIEHPLMADLLMTFADPSESLRESHTKYGVPAAGATGITRRLVSLRVPQRPDRGEAHWYRQSNFSFNWDNIRRFHGLFPEGWLPDGEHADVKYPMLACRNQRWGYATNIAKSLSKLIDPDDRQTSLLPFLIHWMTRILSVQNQIVTKQEAIFKGRLINPIRYIALSVRVSFHQEIFEILSDQDIDVFYQWLSKPRRDATFLSNTIMSHASKIHPDSAFKSEELFYFFCDFVCAHSSDIVECIKLRKQEGRRQVHLAETANAYIELSDGSKNTLPSTSATVLERIIRDRNRFFYFVKPVRIIDGKPFVVLEYRTHIGHSSNDDDYIPFNYRSKVLCGFRDSIEQNFLEKLWA
ncbi:hypothetical protein [Endozoicomonas elysicola]|uniref:Uncharacterized protein n=1 Tax=Endozoicomonas elysicola TaxID=305900 RepID=A0A081KAS2_9GAMM|nr:hypothetical protein [Endozoicomonas elysicola]KEI71248.1 hypothetical protein GV64_11285 [Endozoicomonas elysicola]